MATVREGMPVTSTSAQPPFAIGPDSGADPKVTDVRERLAAAYEILRCLVGSEMCIRDSFLNYKKGAMYGNYLGNQDGFWLSISAW